MLLTIVLGAIFIGLLLISVVMWAYFLRLGLCWARVQNVTTRRIALATVTMIILQSVVSILLELSSPSNDDQKTILGFVQVAVEIFIPCAVLNVVFKARFLRAFQALLLTVLPVIIMYVVVLSLIKPFVFESFLVPTNAMAPTIVGEHRRGVCPTCGLQGICSPRFDENRAVDSAEMICGNFHVTSGEPAGTSVHSGDRILVAKFLTARRWDIVVFQYPEDPSTTFVKRLVGFPGETIQIQGGSVWVDGKRQDPPESIRGIAYLAELPGRDGVDLWGSTNRPAVLGKDEYFVLGDFSARSLDSRLWETGALGHNPFAVPQSHLKGVVTHTYWPPDRWHIYR